MRLCCPNGAFPAGRNPNESSDAVPCTRSGAPLGAFGRTKLGGDYITKSLARESPRSNGEQRTPTKEIILEAAIRLFGEHGYDGTGVQQIVDAASVTKGAFYYNFESKSALLRHIHHRFLDHMLTVVDGISLEN